MICHKRAMTEKPRIPAPLRKMGEGVRARAELAWTEPGPRAPKPKLGLLAGELAFLAEPLRRAMRQPIKIAPAATPRVVMLLPGFAASPATMRPMAQTLERAGHLVKSWGQGTNFGPSVENFAALAERIADIHRQHGAKLHLVGWSLGGIFAREVAKTCPQYVAQVITMGSPFSQSPYANNLWRAYQLVAGHSVAAPPAAGVLAQKPPVQTVAMWSPRDGVIAPRSARGLPGERDRARALRCTHMGFCDSPEAILAVLDELE